MWWLWMVASAVEPGIPLTIQVVDEGGQPVVSAQVRHPDEVEKHRVNTEDASWTGDVVYLPDGELVFAKKLEVPFEVSAPGYALQTVSFVVSKKAKKNVHTVVLERLQIDLEADRGEDGGPSIGFKRDQPRD